VTSNGAHPIETESFGIIDELVDLSGWSPGARKVVARILHATGDPDLAASLVVPESAVVAGTVALASGAPVICDVDMVVSGVRSHLSPRSFLDGATAGPGGYPTRSARAIRIAASQHPEGAVWAIGCAPTALDAVCDLIASGDLRPALVIGMPVGFVGAAESKERLRRVAAKTGTEVITNIGCRGGSAMAAAALNAIASSAPPSDAAGATALFLIGHGTRSEPGVRQFNELVEIVRRQRPGTHVGSGLIELAEPDVDTGLDATVEAGAGRVVAVPIVLLGAGHMKNDGPDALARARLRHRGVHFHYARDLGVHPSVLEVATERAAAAGGRESDAVVLVGRGSSDPDANSDLAKVCRLLADRRGLGTGGDPQNPLGIVEPAFVSLCPPDVTSALDRCHALGASSITLVPYFLFTGVLPERAVEQSRDWSLRHAGTEVRFAPVLGPDERIAELVWLRFDEAAGAGASMNCDMCTYRTGLPGYPVIESFVERSAK
jgi:precorrin isomerase/sirohydrochlorin ferrochelatase